MGEKEEKGIRSILAIRGTRQRGDKPSHENIMRLGLGMGTRGRPKAQSRKKGEKSQKCKKFFRNVMGIETEKERGASSSFRGGPNPRRPF